MKREPIDIEFTKLAHAPWNPRAQIKPADVEDLTASIKADGLIQRLVVVADPKTDGYTVIAGNRRLVACKAAGMEVIPCELLDVDEMTAKRMTLIENLQRRDVDPVLEAELVQSLIDSGMTIAEIASETGRGDKWVWRRKQLTNLDRRYIAELDKRKASATVDCLERIARYPKKLQDECLKRFLEYVNEGRQTTWSNVSYIFERCTKDLYCAKFIKTECRKCGNNSANAPTLFGIEESRKCGVCLNEECFAKKSKAWVEKEARKAEADGRKVVRVDDVGKIPYSWHRSDKYNEEHPVLYVVDGKIPFVMWGRDDKGNSRTAEDEARIAAAKRNKEIKKSCKMLLDFISDPAVLKKLVLDKFETSELLGVPVVVFIVFLAAFGSFNYDDETSVGEKAAEWLNRYHQGDICGVRGEELDQMCERISNELEDALSGYQCREEAKKLLSIFPKLRDIIPPTDLSNIEKAKE